MALRSTIVYPLGTIAVQMGAPENLSLLKANEQSGLIVGLVVATGDHDDVLDPERFVGRVGVAARVHERINLPGETVQITLQGLRRLIVEGVVQTEPFPVVRIKPAKEIPPDPNEVDDLISRIVAGADVMSQPKKRDAVVRAAFNTLRRSGVAPFSTCALLNVAVGNFVASK